MSVLRNTLIHETSAVQILKIKEHTQKNKPKLLVKTGTITIISEIPSAGYYINEPGKYILDKNISWSPPKEGFFFAAIAIQSDDVELDFQNNTLVCDDAGGTQTSIGVIVINGINTCSNVSIKNGIIKNMGLSGLSAISTKTLSITNMSVEGLTYEGFDLFPSGFSILNAQLANLNDCVVKEVSTTAALAGGFMVIGSVNSALNNCSVTNFINNDGVASGFPYFDCFGITTVNCSVVDLTTFYNASPFSKIGHTCIGFMPADCTALIFTGCSANEIKGCCDDCHGMSLFPVNGASIINFTASGVHDGLGAQKTGAKATGLEVYGSNIYVTDCQVENITAIVPQDLQSTGFSACGTNITFNGCTATKVLVYNADGVQDTSHGYGTGFGWAPDPRPQFVHPSTQITYENCVANDCQLGFDTWNHEHSKWINPKINGNGLNHLIQPEDTKRVFSMNFGSELPNSTPSSLPQYFNIYNQIGENIYPENWEKLEVSSS